jgi:hypothetical protein
MNGIEFYFGIQFGMMFQINYWFMHDGYFFACP